MFTGLYAYSLGFTAMLATLKLLQVRRPKLAMVLTAVLTVGFSPLAFAFLCLVLASYAVARRRLGRRDLVIGIGLAVAAAIEGTALASSRADTGVYPFHWIDFLGVMIVSGARRSRRASRARRCSANGAFFALWGLGSVFFYVVPSPFGDNWTRLVRLRLSRDAARRGPRGFRPRRLIVLALACCAHVQPRAVLPPHPVTARQQDPPGELLEAGDRLSPRSRRSLASASRSCRRRSTGRRTGSRRPASRLRAAGSARSTRSTTASLYSKSLDAATYNAGGSARRLSAMWCLRRTAPAPLRLGRRPARGTGRPLACSGIDASSSGVRTGSSTSCVMRLRC